MGTLVFVLFLLAVVVSVTLSAPFSAAGGTVKIELPWISDSETLPESLVTGDPTPSLDDVPLLLSLITPTLTSPLSSTQVEQSTTQVDLGQSAPTNAGFPTTTAYGTGPTSITGIEDSLPSTSTAEQSSATSLTVYPSSAPEGVQYTWTSPSKLSDLNSFNITYFPSGQNNLHIVSPYANQSNSSEILSVSSSASVNITSDDSILELFYPAHSINPGNSPQGGAEFYAQPLDLSNASTVTLEYSVYFPEDFDWVKAGKLPGIYGGHTGCSGGNDANDCFSTRLMWREGGMGELYLYAPRDKQAQSLCETPPQSICDSTYGMSIGRGSFNFTNGDWTHVKQTVTLNTPGKPDGNFSLEVNGKEAIKAAEVYYRSAGNGAGKKGANSPDDSGSASGSCGLLGSLLGGCRRALNDNSLSNSGPNWLIEQPVDVSSTVYGAGSESDTGQYSADAHQNDAISFSGLFFSTFFGGHEPDYATPKDQYTWFKGFNFTVNA